jgi:hypothetical protein
LRIIYDLKKFTDERVKFGLQGLASPHPSARFCEQTYVLNSTVGVWLDANAVDVYKNHRDVSDFCKGRLSFV